MKFNQDDIVYAKHTEFGKVNYIQSHIVGIVNTETGGIWYVICYNTRHDVPQVVVLREYDIKTNEEWKEWLRN